ncbi:hypothetical protein [Winogradskyella sp. UBA3174]|uniref:hypothetical protein n=1 Tax=Winogradskyella sp. UBA3174 TaxID=1947785 RepID=UPI0025E3427D|nr:hypothetical protein [Winogradskyella sp. UBA3174]|tara:strand:+ start:11616 stop:12023 length:408 start_codon:yes stop_codon:yes gene_type:complete
MKHLFTFFIIPLLVINTSIQKENFIGKWEGEDQGEIGYILFDNEGYAAFEIQGQVLGGKEFTMNGEKGKMTYSINYETEPIEIDFIMTKIETGESKTILGIAEFTNESTMIFDMSFDSERPSGFTDTAITLKRVK